MTPLLPMGPTLAGMPPLEAPAPGAEDPFGSLLDDAIATPTVPAIALPGLLGGFLPNLPTPPPLAPAPRPPNELPELRIRVLEYQAERPLTPSVDGWVRDVLEESPVGAPHPVEAADSTADTADTPEEDSFDEALTLLTATDTSPKHLRVEAAVEARRDTFEMFHPSAAEAVVPGRLRLAIEDASGGWELDLHRHSGVMDLVLRGDPQIRDVVDQARQELRVAIAVAGDRAGDVRYEAPTASANDGLSHDQDDGAREETLEQWRTLAERQAVARASRRALSE